MADESPEKEPLDLQDLDTPSVYRKENRAFRKTFHIGGRHHDKEGGSTAKTAPDTHINPKKTTIPMHPTQITALDSLGHTELDSYSDNSSLKGLKTVVKIDKK